MTSRRAHRRQPCFSSLLVEMLCVISSSSESPRRTGLQIHSRRGRSRARNGAIEHLKPKPTPVCLRCKRTSIISLLRIDRATLHLQTFSNAASHRCPKDVWDLTFASKHFRAAGFNLYSYAKWRQLAARVLIFRAGPDLQKNRDTGS